MSLGKTVAQITADFAPIPALCPAVDLLCGLIQLCENISLNRNAARQLGDRCHEMLIAFGEDMKNAPGSMNEAIHIVEEYSFCYSFSIHRFPQIFNIAL